LRDVSLSIQQPIGDERFIGHEERAAAVGTLKVLQLHKQRQAFAGFVDACHRTRRLRQDAGAALRFEQPHMAASTTVRMAHVGVAHRQGPFVQLGLLRPFEDREPKRPRIEKQSHPEDRLNVGAKDPRRPIPLAYPPVK